MKFNKLFILGIASMLTFSGCDDFLDSQDYTGKTVPTSRQRPMMLTKW